MDTLLPFDLPAIARKKVSATFDGIWPSTGIPVLLSPADPALGFLRLNTWLDLLAGAADEAALEILAAAIRRQPPAPLALQQIAAVRAEVCPYCGLRPFREEDEPFGRATFTETLSSALVRQRQVTGVRAGLIPRLRRGGGGFVWDVVTLVPTNLYSIHLHQRHLYSSHEREQSS